MDPSPQPKARSSRPSGKGSRPANVRRPTYIASILRPSADDEDSGGGGEGPYFDLEFSVPKEYDSSDSDDDAIGDCHRSDDPDGDDDLFTPSSKRRFPSSLLKSATKFRVFMLRFKKPRSPNLDRPDSSRNKSKPNKNNKSSKKLTLKFKVEEVPIISLFTRDSSSSRSSGSARSAKLYAEESMLSPAASASDEKKQHPKDVIHKYLNKIKPLYDRRASKRYDDRATLFSGQLTADREQEKSWHSSSSSSGLRIVSRRLRKSRSASAAVAAVRSPPSRKDDSLIEQEDGIQSAIAHCKRSFNAGKCTDLGSDHRLPLIKKLIDYILISIN